MLLRRSKFRGRMARKDWFSVIEARWKHTMGCCLTFSSLSPRFYSHTSIRPADLNLIPESSPTLSINAKAWKDRVMTPTWMPIAIETLPNEQANTSIVGGCFDILRSGCLMTMLPQPTSRYIVGHVGISHVIATSGILHSLGQGVRIEEYLCARWCTTIPLSFCLSDGNTNDRANSASAAFENALERERMAKSCYGPAILFWFTSMVTADPFLPSSRRVFSDVKSDVIFQFPMVSQKQSRHEIAQKTVSDGVSMYYFLTIKHGFGFVFVLTGRRGRATPANLYPDDQWQVHCCGLACVECSVSSDVGNPPIGSPSSKQR
ncbi:hypothetical protein ARMSODRAFT_978441 [Armillaria solidipes]|uniref:Uncharacterized protein n=1 Tax=Armillaria solidipes TaxID=1076256 RepID=A0A2H3B345_9AGAR|nr:hypothetical protein ARMSODRAFT_978441 [Armillaria solidipes]